MVLVGFPGTLPVLRGDMDVCRSACSLACTSSAPPATQAGWSDPLSVPPAAAPWRGFVRTTSWTTWWRPTSFSTQVGLNPSAFSTRNSQEEREFCSKTNQTSDFHVCAAEKSRSKEDLRSMDSRNKITQDMLQPKVECSFSDEEGSSDYLFEFSDNDSDSSDMRWNICVFMTSFYNVLPGLYSSFLSTASQWSCADSVLATRLMSARCSFLQPPAGGSLLCQRAARKLQGGSSPQPPPASPQAMVSITTQRLASDTLWEF